MKADPVVKKITEGWVLAALRERYRPPEWAFFAHVADATGGLRTRTADAIAMNLFPSRGLEMHGFEVKVSRADWLRELKNPAKAEGISKHVDRWWVVAGDKDIVREDEVPAAWGLLIRRGNEMVAKKQAPLLPWAGEPEVDRFFVAGLLRKATEGTIPEKAFHEAVARRVEERCKEEFEWLERDKTKAEGKVKELEKAIRDFEDSSGIRINQFSNNQETGKIVRVLLNGPFDGSGSPQGWLRNTERDLSVALENIRWAVAAISRIEKFQAEVTS